MFNYLLSPTYASPGEIKRRAVSWTLKKKLARNSQEQGGGAGLQRERVGFLLQLFPNGGATDIVFVTVLHSIWDGNRVVL